MQDALAFGGAAISLLNHADRVRCACLAQLVNVIAPIMTETGGPAWRQTIFWPFADFSRFGRGDVLRTRITCDTYDTAYFDPAGMDDEVRTPLAGVPYLKLAAAAGAAGELTLFALNRELASELPLEVTARGFGGLVVAGATTLHDADLKAVNTRNVPDRIKPTALTGISVNGGAIATTLPPASWSVIRLAPA